MKMLGIFLSMWRKFKRNKFLKENTEKIRCDTYLTPMSFTTEDDYVEIDEEGAIKFEINKNELAEEDEIQNELARNELAVVELAAVELAEDTKVQEELARNELAGVELADEYRIQENIAYQCLVKEKVEFELKENCCVNEANKQKEKRRRKKITAPVEKHYNLRQRKPL